jgi:hypothetical protein
LVYVMSGIVPSLEKFTLIFVHTVSG